MNLLKFLGWGPGAMRLPERPKLTSEVLGLALRALQSAKDAKTSLLSPTSSCMFLGIISMFHSCFRHSKVRLTIKNPSITCDQTP
ncbi:hypothetical protein MTR67_013669 [Solanum verrucosum]|uniref:Uncharacterized protein n=1 Tax=Solanum verrucosum TaxID=315347 RepID=A0AAF0QI09_SOLVR|nr:hypothetical protein MTR67_013669 [Solanum verrucosum]